MIKILAISVCSILLAGSIALIDLKSDHPSSLKGPLPTTSALPTQIYASGFIEGKTEDIKLRPNASGRVEEVLVRLGDWVDGGQVVLRLDDRTERAQLAASLARLQLAVANLDRLVNGASEEERQEARALLSAKRARLKQSIRTWQRVQTLRAQDAIAQQEADDQEGIVQTLSAEVEACEARLNQLESPARDDELRAAQARVSVAQADYELNQVALDRTALRAPVRAQVLNLHVEPGETILPGGSEPVMVLADTSQLRIRAYVEEIDAPRIECGMSAVVTADGLPGQAFEAVVESVSPRMNLKRIATGRSNELYDTKLLEVMLTLKDGQPLIVGLRVDVTIDVGAN